MHGPGGVCAGRRRVSVWIIDEAVGPTAKLKWEEAETSEALSDVLLWPSDWTKIRKQTEHRTKKKNLLQQLSAVAGFLSSYEHSSSRMSWFELCGQRWKVNIEWGNYILDVRHQHPCFGVKSIFTASLHHHHELFYLTDTELRVVVSAPCTKLSISHYTYDESWQTWNWRAARQVRRSICSLNHGWRRCRSRLGRLTKPWHNSLWQPYSVLSGMQHNTNKMTQCVITIPSSLTPASNFHSN